MEILKFNIRVYGLVIRDNKQILLTDEFRLGMRMTKFPGGGLRFGEGTVDCLRREFREELNSEIEFIRHFYTTDYYQPTMLLAVPQQLISIYYLADLPALENIAVTSEKFDFADVDGEQTFRWADLYSLKEDELTFPIDRKVLGLLKSEYI